MFCQLPSLYNEILNHPNTSDDLRRSTESKLLQRKYQHLEAAPVTGVDSSLKQKLLKEVVELSSGAVLLGLPDELAWMFFIESKDAYNIRKLVNIIPGNSEPMLSHVSADYDFQTLRRFIDIFPNLPLAKLLQGYFNYIHLPLDLNDTDEDEVPEALDENGDSFSSVLVCNSSSSSSTATYHAFRMLLLIFRTAFWPTESFLNFIGWKLTMKMPSRLLEVAWSS